MNRVNRDVLAESLQACGVRPGEALIVHSSMKALGHVEGGPSAVVGALRDVLGDRGTLLMPVFSSPQPDGLFHVMTTPSRTGLVTETFRTMPGVVRSRHPTHSVAAWGARAREWTQGHERLGGLGANSPLHRAASAGARVLMIGCDLRSCSLVHVAEAIVRVPYLGKVWYDGYERTLRVITPLGQAIEIPPIDPPTCSAAFCVVQKPLDARGRIDRGKLGAADCLLIDAADILLTAIDLLREDSLALLCDNPACPVCPRARTHVVAAS